MKYAEHFEEQFGSKLLAQFLLKRPMAKEIGDDGTFTKDACDDVDKAFLMAAEKGIKGFYMPAEIGHGTNPDNKWRTISSLQKAIRFGLVEDAQFAVSAAYDMDKAHTLRRLGVIAVEDCLMGNPLMVGIVLAAMGNAHWRKSLDERRFMIWVARELAAGVKDRTAVNLLVTAELEQMVPKKEWAKATDGQLIATAMNEDFTFPQRMCAAWLLAGTRRYAGNTFPDTNNRKPTGLFRMMVEIGCPRLLLYFAAKTASRLSEAMFAAMPLVHEMLRAAPVVDHSHQAIYPEKVGKLLGAAYDQYVREGKVAIKKFFRESKELEPYVKAMPAGAQDRLQFGGVFHAEGGCLGKRVTYGPDCQALIALVGGPSRFADLGDLAPTYLEAIREEIGFLNQCRSKVLWATLHSK
ncbi:MAG: hypothetical protein M9945_14045 [Aquamicrobium sp.]|uniref:hypothetical protein n=1 Tax=Aquamicrobium sp. TaxID=1872579 RepID=UPI00349E61E2|nr:hypothetical protein [Aquamicrobium sp.]